MLCATAKGTDTEAISQQPPRTLTMDSRGAQSSLLSGMPFCSSFAVVFGQCHGLLAGAEPSQADENEECRRPTKTPVFMGTETM
jgi:hypothetical protein